MTLLQRKEKLGARLSLKQNECGVLYTFTNLVKQLETQGQLNFSLGPIKDFKRGQHRAQMLYLQLP